MSEKEPVVAQAANKETLRDLKHIEAYLKSSGAPQTMLNRLADVRAAVNAPAEQASKQVPTIDTPEFRKLMRKAWARTSWSASRLSEEERALIAHIDAKLAGQPAAPVAATEQATIDTPKFREMYCKERLCITRPLADPSPEFISYIDSVKLSPLATPADAGAALTDDLHTEIVGAVARGWCAPINAHKEMDSYLAHAIVLEVEQVLARLSTPAAPVTANKDQELARIAAYWEDQARRGCVDALECALREAWNVASQSGAPVTASQPAAQVPSIDRDSVLEEAAQACMRATPDRAHVRRIGEAAHYTACRDAIRALKGQPAAAHAAKADKALLDDLDAWVQENKAAGHEFFSFNFDTKSSAREQIADDMADRAAHAAHDQKGGE